MLSNHEKSAHIVIDRAIRENRFGKNLLYVLSTLIVITGIFAIIYGALKGQGLVSLSGSIATALIFPAYRQAMEIRRENIAIRLLEAPLRIAKTSEEAANAITTAFKEIFTKAGKGKKT